MNLQEKSYRDATAAAASQDLQRQEIRPPAYGGPQRDAINSVVDGIVGDICNRIVDLRKMLDAIEQQVLESAAKSKAALNDHVGICVRINDEIRHMQTVIEELKADVV
jgi:hypothetical protein